MDKTAKTTVWYREPWPWIVMSGPAVAVIGSLVSAYLAVHGADPVVDEDYYQHGLQINRQLEREHQLERLRMQTEVQVERARASSR
jgi:hypothetical protein